MGAPSTPVLDNFSGTLASWTNPALNLGPSTFSISGGGIIGVAANSTGMVWTASFGVGTRLECYATISNGIANGTEFALILSSNTVNAHSYRLLYENASAYQIRRYSDDFTQSQISSGTHAVSAGDKLALQQSGSAINVWHYTGGLWALFDSVVDSTYTDMAYVGIHDFNGVNIYDDFGGGTFVVSLASDTPMPIMGRGATW